MELYDLRVYSAGFKHSFKVVSVTHGFYTSYLYVYIIHACGPVVLSRWPHLIASECHCLEVLRTINDLVRTD